MRPLIIVLCTSFLATPGCATSVGRGKTLYEEQSYIEAAEVFERTQSRLATMPAEERAHYGLYRGLTLRALGDLRGARRWLDYAETQYRAVPGLLDRDEYAVLSRSRSELADLQRSAWPKTKPGWTEGVAATSRETVGKEATQAR